MQPNEPYSPRFGQPFVVGPPGDGEARVMTRITILPDEAEFADWVRWRVVGDDFVLNDHVTLPPLMRPIPPPGPSIPIEVETDQFVMRFKILIPPSRAKEPVPAGFVFTIPPGLHAPHRGRGLSALADPVQPDWEFVRRCLEVRGIEREEDGCWVVDGKSVGTRDAARVVLGIG